MYRLWKRRILKEFHNPFNKLQDSDTLADNRDIIHNFVFFIRVPSPTFPLIIRAIFFFQFSKHN